MLGRILDAALVLGFSVVAARAFDARGSVGAAPDTLTVRHIEGDSPSIWSAVAPMRTPRFIPQAIRLHDGRIFVVGGFSTDVTSLDSAEIFDPRTGGWTTTPPMAEGRYNMAAALLKDGRVLAAGGRRTIHNSDVKNSLLTQIYDPVKNAWGDAGEMPQPIDGAMTFLRPDGKVLAIGGGYADGTHTSDTAVFDPASGTWTPGPPMNDARIAFAGATMKDGRFLVAGGWADAGSALSSAEIYDPRTGGWTMTGSMKRRRANHALLTLPDGKILAAGGTNDPSAEIYDPKTGVWKMTSSPLFAHMTGQLGLYGSKALLVGGQDASGRREATEEFDPLSGLWNPGPAMNEPRLHFAMVPLADGRLFAVGGGPNGYPAPATTGAEILGPDLGTAQARAPIARIQPQIPRPQPLIAPVRPYPSPAPVRAYPAKTAERPHDFALVVGVGEYKNLPAADYAENDAREMAGALGALGVPEENVVLLTGAKATLAEVSKYTEEWLPRRVSKDSRVYFYFSGHGAPDVKDGSAYLMPWDGDAAFVKSTGFPLTRLYAALGGLPVKRVVAMIDSCFSGAGGRSVLVAGARPLVTVKLPTAESPRISVLTASESEEVAGGYPERGHGLFSYYLLQGLGGAAAPEGADHLTLEQLYGYVHKHVIIDARRQNREQTPTLTSPDPKLRLY